MAKKTIQLVFETPVIKYWGNDKSIYGYLKIVGLGYWNTNNTEWDSAYADYDVTSVSAKIKGEWQECTEMYRIDKSMNGDMSEIVERAIFAHMEMLLFTQPDPSNLNVADAAYTDTNPHNLRPDEAC